MRASSAGDAASVDRPETTNRTVPAGTSVPAFTAVAPS
ncbi:hypothetical protein JOE59_000563 [Agromyces cerinus]|nr:hypothetical protein [Agromyces cerinus]